MEGEFPQVLTHHTPFFPFPPPTIEIPPHPPEQFPLSFPIPNSSIFSRFVYHNSLFLRPLSTTRLYPQLLHSLHLGLLPVHLILAHVKLNHIIVYLCIFFQWTLPSSLLASSLRLYERTTSMESHLSLMAIISIFLIYLHLLPLYFILASYHLLIYKYKYVFALFNLINPVHYMIALQIGPKKKLVLNLATVLHLLFH